MSPQSNTGHQDNSRLIIGALIALIVVLIGLFAVVSQSPQKTKKSESTAHQYVPTQEQPGAESQTQQLAPDWQIYQDDLEKYSLTFPPQTFLMYIPVENTDEGHRYGVFYSDESAQACATEADETKNNTGPMCRQAKYFVTIGGNTQVVPNTTGMQTYTDTRARNWRYLRTEANGNTRIVAEMTPNTGSEKLQFEFIIPTNSRMKDESEMIAKKTMDAYGY